MNATSSSRFRYLAKNVGLLAISSFGSKILVVLLVPLYTAVLSTDEYGTFDLVSNAVELLIPILTLNAADGVMRFAMEDNADKAKIARFGLITVAIGTIITSASLLWSETPWMSVLGNHVVYIPAMFAATALYTMMTQLSRGCERVADVAIAGIINTIVLVAFNIACLLIFKLGLDGFFIANISAQLIPGLWLIFRNRQLLTASKNDQNRTDLRELLRYAMPLATTTLGWLIVAVSDRFIIAFFCGLEANGLYSIAYKIPAILNVMQGVFIQAWQISAIKEYGTEESDRFFESTYDTMESLLAICCSIMLPITPTFAKLLFQQDFYSAWIYVPYLLIYVVFNVSSGIWGGIFSAI